MSYTPVDFIAPNVEVCIQYDIKDNDVYWELVKIISVEEHGLTDGERFIVCHVRYQGETSIFTETFWDKDYLSKKEGSWKFSENFAPLVHKLLDDNMPDIQGYDNQTNKDNTNTNNTYVNNVDDGDDENDENDENDEDDTDEDEDDNDTWNEEEEYLITRKTSLTNKIFASLFAFSPYIASAVVIYNARGDILSYLKRQYC
jgi:hypothetical protein